MSDKRFDPKRGGISTSELDEGDKFVFSLVSAHLLGDDQRGASIYENADEWKREYVAGALVSVIGGLVRQRQALFGESDVEAFNSLLRLARES